MAIANTILAQTVFGNKRVVIGSSVLSGTVATGDVVTGLSNIDFFIPVVSGATQNGIAVNETLPLASGTVTAVVETNDATFYWIAIGT